MKLQLVFEELTQEILSGVKNINAVIEHSEESGEIMLDVKYDGPMMNPSEGDEVSYSLLKAEASDIQYMAGESENFTNRVKIFIR